MVRSYRRAPPPSPPKRKQSRSCVWWFLTGIALGAVAGNFVATRHPTANQPPDVARESRPAPVQPKFQFQQLLNDATVETGDRLPPPPPPAPRPQPLAQPLAAGLPDTAIAPPMVAPRSGTYVVQAGSFVSAADAERRKAELATLGIPSGIQTATLASGKKAYRVRTGAYSSKQAAEQVRAQLQRHGKEGLTIPIN